jgi:multiple sugar transport system ATP-binding protein
MVAGFEEVSAGAIALANRRVERLAPAARNVAMAFEGYSLYPPLTVRDNIAFALKRGRLSASDVSRRVQEMAALVEIESILDCYPNAISGGQQQRASLARALVRDADLYVLDEPMGQLEPQLRAVLRGRLKRLLKDRAMTSIFVTHDQTEANALADRIAVMEGGALQQFANQHDLKERPANLYDERVRCLGHPQRRPDHVPARQRAELRFRRQRIGNGGPAGDRQPAQDRDRRSSAPRRTGRRWRRDGPRRLQPVAW